jgi:hypothetical protein
MRTVKEQKGPGLVLRWPLLEQRKKTTRREWALRILFVVLLAVGQEAYVRLKPLDPQVVAAEAIWCSTDYDGARTMIDTLRLDAGFYVVTSSRWQRIPTCGELRTKNLLSARPFTVPPPRLPIVVGPHPQ